MEGVDVSFATTDDGSVLFTAMISNVDFRKLSIVEGVDVSLSDDKSLETTGMCLYVDLQKLSIFNVWYKYVPTLT